MHSLGGVSLISFPFFLQEGNLQPNVKISENSQLLFCWEGCKTTRYFSSLKGCTGIIELERYS
jgi:hypothetical protein